MAQNIINHTVVAVTIITTDVLSSSRTHKLFTEEDQLVGMKVKTTTKGLMRLRGL